jgi:hypothetical protein
MDLASRLRSYYNQCRGSCCIGCHIRRALAAPHWGIGDGPASVIVLTGGFAVRMFAVRFHWRLRTWTAAGIDAGGAH